MRWCPAPNSIKAHYFDAQPVESHCTYIFCFGCGEEWHDPIKCKWLKKCDEDWETRRPTR